MTIDIDITDSCLVSIVACDHDTLLPATTPSPPPKKGVKKGTLMLLVLRKQIVYAILYNSNIIYQAGETTMKLK